MPVWTHNQQWKFVRVVVAVYDLKVEVQSTYNVLRKHNCDAKLETLVFRKASISRY